MYGGLYRWILINIKAVQLVCMVYWGKHFRRLDMKQLLSILIIVTVLSAVGCAMLDKRSNSYALPKHKVYIHCNGKVLLKNGQIIYFNSAVFTANTEMVRIESTMVHQTILWSNIYKVEITNAEMQRQEQEDSTTGRKERDGKEYPGERTGHEGSNIDEIPSTPSG